MKRFSEMEFESYISLINISHVKKGSYVIYHSGFNYNERTRKYISQ